MSDQLLGCTVPEIDHLGITQMQITPCFLSDSVNLKETASPAPLAELSRFPISCSLTCLCFFSPLPPLCLFPSLHDGALPHPYTGYRLPQTDKNSPVKCPLLHTIALRVNGNGKAQSPSKEKLQPPGACLIRFTPSPPRPDICFSWAIFACAEPLVHVCCHNELPGSRNTSCRRRCRV